MPSSKFIALGGIAAGLGQALQHKADQQHEDEKQHQALITNLVSQGIASGSVTDPDAAFQFLMSGGKSSSKGKSGKGGAGASAIPPGIQTLIDGAKGLQDQGAGGGGSGPSGAPEALAGAPLPGSPLGAVGAPSIPGPATAPGPGFSFLSGPQRDARAVALKEAEAGATTTGTINAKIALVRKGVDMGIFPDLETGYERVGLREPRLKTWAPRPGDVTPAEQVPPGSLMLDGTPVVRTPGTYVKSFVLTRPDGTEEIRYVPSMLKPSASASVDPAALRVREPAIKREHPDWTPEQITAEASKQITQEAANRNAGVVATTQGKNEALGITPSVYDSVPQVEMDPATRAPTPASQKAFSDAIAKLPHGPSLLPLIKDAASYDFNPNDITKRQVGGLNQAEFESLVKRYDPSYIPANFQQVQNLRLDWQPKGQVGRAMVSAKTVTGHMNDLAKAAAVLNKYQTDRFGGLGNWTATNWARIVKSDPKAQEALKTYQTKQKAVADELKRLFTVTGAGSQKEIDDWYALGSPYATPTEKAAFVKAAGELMKGRIRPLTDHYEAVVGKPPKPGQGFSADDYRRLQSLGVDVSDIGGPSTPGGPGPSASGTGTQPQASPEVVAYLKSHPQKNLEGPTGTWALDPSGNPVFTPK